MKGNKSPLLFLLCLVFFSCATPPRVKEAVEAITEVPEVPPVTAEPAVPEAAYLTIIAAGDNLYHDVMIRSGEEGDYLSAYSEIRPLVEKADIAFINQETLLAGESFGFSGYPRFNSPRKLGEAIAAAGFDAVNHATNHIMDKGEDAVIATLDFWDSVPGITVLGIHRSAEERARARLLRKNSITTGFLSYTYGTNGLPVPEDKPYLAALTDMETMAAEIDAVRPLCDFLVVSMHWGEEYSHSVSKNQETLAAFLAEHRVDLVLGHHPHVIQPVEYITRPDGRSMLCFYSLGNLISAQTRDATMLGALAYVKIEKKPPDGSGGAGTLTFTDAGAIPLVTHFEKGYTGFKTYPLYGYTEGLLKKHWKNQTEERITMDYLSGLAGKVLGGKAVPGNPFPAP